MLNPKRELWKKRKNMSVEKINIVLFGSGKVGSLLVNQILKNQDLLLLEEKDIRISVVVSSTLVFIENENKKNAWDVTFIQSSKRERIGNIVSYIQEKELSNTIIIDTTKGSDVLPYYAYFIQNGFDVISVNADTEKLSQKQSDEIRISSEVYGKKFFKLGNTSITKEQAVEFVLRNILDISKEISLTTLVKKVV